MHSRSSLFVFASILGIGFLLFFNLDNPQNITQPDETVYLSIAVNMHQAGDWLTPLWQNKPAFYKPPLLYWGMLVPYSLFGVTLFTSRFMVAIWALLGIIYTYLLGKEFFTNEDGLLAALIFSGCLGMAKFSRIAMMDIPLTALLVGAWFHYIKSIKGKSLHLYISFFMVGLSVLFKGPVSVVIFILSIIAYHGFENSLKDLLKRAYLGASLLLVGIAVPWFIIMLFRHGNSFWQFFFLKENMGKFTAVWQSPHLVLGGMLVFLLPFTFHWLAAVYLSIKNRYLYLEDKRVLMIPLGIASILLLYFIPAIKYPHYALPTLPLCAVWIAGGNSHCSTARFMTMAHCLFQGLLVIVTVLLVLLLALIMQLFQPLPLLALSGLVLVIILLMSSVIIIHRRGLFALSLLPYVWALAIMVSIIIPQLNTPILPHTVPHKPQYTYKLPAAFYSFLLDSPIRRIDKAAQFNRYQGKSTRIICRDEHLYELTQRYKLHKEITWSVWRQSIPLADFITALKAGEVILLKQKMHVVRLQ
jgi:4-amino-4-deoxy-L-arabinose transferase-like glycosyltransferase